jgi:hypothetical protein
MKPKWWVDFGETSAREFFCLRSEIKSGTEQCGFLIGCPARNISRTDQHTR